MSLLEYIRKNASVEGRIHMVGMRNKRLVFLLMALLMAMLVVGCGGGAQETGNKPGTSTGDTEVKANDLLAKGKSLPGLSYDSVATMAGMEQINTKVWVKEGNMRIEMDIPEIGKKMISIVDSNEKAVYSYSPEQKMATKMPLVQSEVDTTSPQDYTQNMKPESMKYIKAETLDGKECLVYEVTDQSFKGKMWLWKDYGIPLRIEATSEGETMLVEYKNVQVANIDDSLFKLPAGVEVMDLGNMTIPQALP